MLKLFDREMVQQGTDYRQKYVTCDDYKESDHSTSDADLLTYLNQVSKLCHSYVHHGTENSVPDFRENQLLWMKKVTRKSKIFVSSSRRLEVKAAASPATASPSFFLRKGDCRFGWDCVHLVLRPLTGLLLQSRMIDDGECAVVGGMRTGKGNRSIWTKPAPLSLWPSQIPLDLTWVQARGGHNHKHVSYSEIWTWISGGWQC
jgi:hypothetical protein